MEDAVISSSMQDYLEAILEIAEKEGIVRITDIAARLNIAKASVCQTVSSLKDMGLVNQKSYGPVELTEDGMQMAVKVRQYHRKLRQFLIEVLGVNPKVAEKDACLIEHAVSPQTMDKLTEFLIKNGYVKNSEEVVHEGKNVLNISVSDKEKGESVLMSVNTKALSELKIGQEGKVIRIVSKGAVRKRILEMGITPGTEISVKGIAPFGDPMELLIKGYRLSLRKEEAADIFVEVK